MIVRHKNPYKNMYLLLKIFDINIVSEMRIEKFEMLLEEINSFTKDSRIFMSRVSHLSRRKEVKTLKENCYNARTLLFFGNHVQIHRYVDGAISHIEIYKIFTDEDSEKLYTDICSQMSKGYKNIIQK